MLCPDNNRTRLLIKNVDKLSKWLDTDGRTDPELAYWIPKYILMRGDKPFLTMGYMSPKLKALAKSQDQIDWRNFTEGHILTHFYEIQTFHLAMSSSLLNGADWTKHFITKILQITHLQWIYQNTLLHDKCQGYLHNKRAEELMKEMELLADLAPEDVPEASRFLLKINFTELSKYYPETQKYWILAVNADLAAQNQERARGARAKQVRNQVNTKIPSRQKLGMVAIEQQIQKDGMHQPPTSNDITGHHTQPTIEPYVRKQTLPSAAMNLLESNKRMRKTGLATTDPSLLCQRLHA
jgi:hypothetical protein